MDKIKKYKKIVKETLQQQLHLPSDTFPNLQRIYIEDAERGHFFVYTIGWHLDRYHHNAVYHIEIKKNGKVWIHAYNTDAKTDQELIKKGIGKEDIIGGMIKPYSLVDYQNQTVEVKAA